MKGLMDPGDKARAIKRYDDRLVQCGPTAQALGFRDEAQQALRFAILSDIDDLDGKSILDVGCGFGDFYDYLLDRGQRTDYTGIDISPKVLEVARERHPDLRFEERDILLQPMDETFDYVVESCVFNLKLQNNEEFARAMLSAMYQRCNQGVAANMIIDNVDYRDDYLYYYNPEQYLSYCKSLSRFITLRHDYPLYEFTLYIYRMPKLALGQHG